MEKHMDKATYDEFLRTWGDVNSDTERMQAWVDSVRSFIGFEVYEDIKNKFQREEVKRKERESAMHCTQTFSKPVNVKFKQDIGADLLVQEDLKTFKRGFEVVLCGVVDEKECLLG